MNMTIFLDIVLSCTRVRFYKEFLSSMFTALIVENKYIRKNSGSEEVLNFDTKNTKRVSRKEEGS